MRISDWSSDVCSSDLRAGTTFRKLPDADKAGLDEAKAIALMVAQPSMIKRPVVEQGGALLVGFKPERYAAMFGESKKVDRKSVVLGKSVYVRVALGGRRINKKKTEHIDNTC